MKKIYLLLVSVILGIGVWSYSPNSSKANGTIYDKIDKIVETNKPKAKRLYNVLGDLQEYIGEKLGKKQKTKINGRLYMKDVYGFDLSALKIRDYKISFFDERMAKGFFYDPQINELEDYYNRNSFVLWYLGNPIVFSKSQSNINSKKIIIRIKKDANNVLYDSIVKKYKKIVAGKTKLNSLDFTKVITLDENGKDYIYDSNIFNYAPSYAQTSPINPHFIKNRDSKIKGIAFYVFEGNGNIASMDLHYKIYSIRDNAMMEVDINIIEPENTEKGEWSDELIVDKSIDTEKFQEKHFKNGYYNGVGQEDEWQKRKEKIEYFEDVVRES